MTKQLILSDVSTDTDYTVEEILAIALSYLNDTDLDPEDSDSRYDVYNALMNLEQALMWVKFHRERKVSPDKKSIDYMLNTYSIKYSENKFNNSIRVYYFGEK